MDRLKEIDKKLIPLRRVHANYFPSFDRFLLIDSIRGSNAKNTFRLPPPSSYFDRSTKERRASSVSLIRDATQPQRNA